MRQLFDRRLVLISRLAMLALCLVTPASAQFTSSNMEFMAQIPVPGTGFDIWGWTDSQTGTEYALIGHSDGVDFYGLNDPYNPSYVGRWTGHTGFDVKVYNDYAYAVNGGSFGSMQIFDLSQLRGVTTPQTFFSTTQVSPSYHNIFINEDTGYLYGASPGIAIKDLSNPLSPSMVATVSGGGHDSMSVIYDGPDTRYTGKEILFGSQESTLGIYDVDNKSAIQPLWTGTYPNRDYIHQSWLSQDQQYLFIADELDTSAGGTRTHVMDVSDLEQPQYIGYYSGPTGAIDHNLYVKGELLYLANYTAGVRVIRLDDPGNLDMTEIAFLDTYPNNNNYTFNGAFSVYPYFESGVLIASDMSRGLFVMKLDLGNDADFDDNMTIDCRDIDALTAAVAGGVHPIEYDLTNDGLVTYTDVEEWLAQAGEVLIGPGASILPGDATLDGLVDEQDFNEWNSNKFSAVAAWCSGDFTADGIVDGSDFSVWNEHKFQSSVATVPEPAHVLAWLLALGWSRLARRMRQA